MSELTNFPIRVGIFALAKAFDGAGAHDGVGRRFPLRRHEITRIGDLRGERGLIGAAEIPVGLVAPVLGGAAANCKVPWPLSALVRDLRLEAKKAQPDRRNKVGTRRIGSHNGTPMRPRAKKCVADRFDGRRATGPRRRHDGDGSAAEFAIEAGEFAQLRRGMAIESAASSGSTRISSVRGLSASTIGWRTR